MISSSPKVIIIGSNDYATACAIRLFRAGFRVSLVCKKPATDLYYFRNFSSVLSIGYKEINEVAVQSFADFIYHMHNTKLNSIQEFIDFLDNDRKISALSEKDLNQIKLEQFDFCVICDSSLSFNQYSGDQYFITISCVADIAADYSIVTSAVYTGNVNYKFLNFPLKEEAVDNKIIYSEKDGVFIAEKNPGETCHLAERIAKIDDIDVLASHAGYVDGILQSGLIVEKGSPIFSIVDGANFNPKILPEKSFSVAGGVLEAIMYHKSLSGL